MSGAKVPALGPAGGRQCEQKESARRGSGENRCPRPMAEPTDLETAGGDCLGGAGSSVAPPASHRGQERPKSWTAPSSAPAGLVVMLWVDPET